MKKQFKSASIFTVGVVSGAIGASQVTAMAEPRMLDAVSIDTQHSACLRECIEDLWGGTDVGGLGCVFDDPAPNCSMRSERK